MMMGFGETEYYEHCIKYHVENRFVNLKVLQYLVECIWMYIQWETIESEASLEIYFIFLFVLGRNVTTDTHTKKIPKKSFFFYSAMPLLISFNMNPKSPMTCWEWNWKRRWNSAINCVLSKMYDLFSSLISCYHFNMQTLQKW